MDTSLEHAHEGHVADELGPYFKPGRARTGVIMLIISDALSVLAVLAAGGYLSALNTENQFKVAGDFAPAFVPNLLIMIGLVLSGVCYYLWARKASKPEGKGPAIFLLLALLLMLIVGVAETWLGAALKYGGPNVTIDAYQSVQLLIVWFTAMHLLLAVIVGVLLGGRLLRGRLKGQEFLVSTTGYWWYYTIIAGLLLWIFGILL